MKRDDLRRLFAQARSLTGETDYVVLGSLAALGYTGELPPRMAMSLDVDAYGKSDPDRIFELAPKLGEGSAFQAENGYYLDSLGWAHYRLGNLEEAERHLERAVALTNGDAVILEHLGDVRAAGGDGEAARKAWERALAADPDNEPLKAKIRQDSPK